MTTLRLLLGSVAVVAAAAVVSAVVAAVLVGSGLPAQAVVFLSIVAMLPVAWGGALLVARRWPPRGPVELVAAAGGGLVLGTWMLLGSDTDLWFRVVVLLALAAAGVAGARQGARYGGPGDRDLAPAGRRGERGSGSLEFVGVVILAAVLVAAAVGATATSSPAARDKIWATICQITGGECSPADAPSNEDYKPEDCEIYSAEERLNATVDIAIVRLEGGAALQRVEKSNGEVEITILDEGRAGVAGGLGGHGKIRFGETTLGVDGELDAAATVGLQGGQTYVFDSHEEADAFQSYLRREKVEDIVGSGVPLIGSVNSAVEWVTGEEPPTNDGVQKTFVRFDEHASVSLGGSLGLGAGGGLELEGMVALGMEHDRGKDADDPGDDKQTMYFQVDWAGEANIGLPMVKGADFAKSGSGIIKVTTTNDGQGDEVQIISRDAGGFEIGFQADEHSTATVGNDRAPKGLEDFGIDFKAGTGGSTVVTQTLALDSPESKQAFLDWMTAGGATNMAATTAASSGWADSEDGDNVTSFGDGADGFAELMTQQAKVSVVEYDNDTWGLGGGLGLSLAVKAGLDLGYEDTEANAIEAAYLGAPDLEGNRTAYDLPECVG